MHLQTYDLYDYNLEENVQAILTNRVDFYFPKKGKLHFHWY